MNVNTEQKVRFVPAVCTKCGASLEVDPSQEAAVCPYCDTAFIVEKAINNYNIQHANIEHVDNVTVDLKGSVDSVLGFASEQMHESRQASAAERRESRMMSAAFMKTFFLGFFGLAGVMVIMWFILTIGHLW